MARADAQQRQCGKVTADTRQHPEQQAPHLVPGGPPKPGGEITHPPLEQPTHHGRGEDTPPDQQRPASLRLGDPFPA